MDYIVYTIETQIFYTVQRLSLIGDYQVCPSDRCTDTRVERFSDIEVALDSMKTKAKEFKGPTVLYLTEETFTENGECIDFDVIDSVTNIPVLNEAMAD